MKVVTTFWVQSVIFRQFNAKWAFNRFEYKVLDLKSESDEYDQRKYCLMYIWCVHQISISFWPNELLLLFFEGGEVKTQFNV